MTKVSDLFDIFYGTNLELNKLTEVNTEKDGINFVSRTRKNNGVSAIVLKVSEIEPLEAGLITVAVGSSTVMESFVQPKPFYSGRDIYCLKPKKKMLLCEKIYYCCCLKHNKYKYNYGRQANKTLASLELPDKIPDWVYKEKDINFKNLKSNLKSDPTINFNTQNWKEISCGDLFNVIGGKSFSVATAKKIKGTIPLISATRYNNGINLYTGYEATHKANVITVAKNGSSVCEAFYQDKPFCRTTDTWVLESKFKLNKYIALFFTTLIKKERYRFNYGRKLNKNLMENMKWKIPFDIEKNEPDWNFIENFVKTLKYSKNI